MANLPYVTTVGTLTNMLDKIKKAAVPPSFSQDFVSDTLLMKGGTARSMIPFIKKMGLVADDGTPTELYKQFRNEQKSKTAIAESMKRLYAPLFAMNENVHSLADSEIKGLIVENTGAEKDSRVPECTLMTFRALRELADFNVPVSVPAQVSEQPSAQEIIRSLPETREQPEASGAEGINLSYTINLNLPATSEIEVFDAIFKSLKEHLLKK